MTTGTLTIERLSALNCFIGQGSNLANRRWISHALCVNPAASLRLSHIELHLVPIETVVLIVSSSLFVYLLDQLGQLFLLALGEVQCVTISDLLQRLDRGTSTHYQASFNYRLKHSPSCSIPFVPFSYKPTIYFVSSHSLYTIMQFLMLLVLLQLW